LSDDHTAVFAISDSEVNFHSFARLFRDALNCRNALFLMVRYRVSIAPNSDVPTASIPWGPSSRP
jgi:uncharacterized protein YigE (DUF2233 family)